MKIVSEVRGIEDLYTSNDEIKKQTIDANTTDIKEFNVDVVIIGTGAGGGTSAEILTKAGLKVLMIEEGPLKSSNDFNMNEGKAYNDLYQESGGRVNKDASISILQGKCVGGTTVINWTSSFRTPPQTLKYWAEKFKLKGCSEQEMTPWFAKMEQRLNISPWLVSPNENNNVLKIGCEKLGIKWKVIPRNVKGCWNLGYCGMGCPTNAKQSMLVSTIPSALKAGAHLLYLAQAKKLIHDGSKITEVVCVSSNNNEQISVKASYVINAAGGINGPALLLRSKIPDPYNLIGKRTFLHPTVFSFAQYSHDISPFYGAPQSIYSDHYQWINGTDGKVGYKLEVPPLHPGITSILLMGHGKSQVEDMSQLPNTGAMIALLRDGFNNESLGGNIELSTDGSPIVDYKLTKYMWDGVRRAHLSMAKVQFSSGAVKVRPAHQNGVWYKSYQDFQLGLENTTLQNSSSLIGSAHVMGGIPMGEDKKSCLVNSEGKYHYLDNLWVFDGSVFPTSVGANPQLSIYGFVCKNATSLSIKLTQKVGQ